MYLINTTLTVNWYLLTGAAPPDLADLDVRIIPPEGNSIYIPGAIDPANYTPSTETTKGLVVYEFTPDILGLWQVSLNRGTSSANTNYYTHNIIVSINDMLTEKFVDSSLL